MLRFSSRSIVVLTALWLSGVGTAHAGTAETGTTGSGTVGSTTGPEPFHESTLGPPLFEGPAVNDPPIRIKLDDDGVCRVATPSGHGIALCCVLFALGLGRHGRRR